VVAISVGGSRAALSVTRNCFNALTSLRRPDAARSLWVDAICIDQTDVAEQSVQVKIMNKVYARGLRTVIYLGEATPGTDLLFEELAEAELSLDRPAPSATIVQQLEELLIRPWFRRVWVVQEAYVSKSRLVMCGRRQATWKVLHDCLLGFGNNNRVTADVLPPVFMVDKSPHNYNCIWQNLWVCLNVTRALLATDSGDKLFALKALLGRNQDEIDQLIDYRRTIPAIFTDVATHLLNSMGLVSLIAIRSPHDRSMVSWVPDWSQTHSWNSEMLVTGDIDSLSFRSGSLQQYR